MPTPRAMVCQEVAGGIVAFEGGLALPGLEAWVITRPYQGQTDGGDVHYISSCATGRITRILLADVSGHGQRVAQTSAALRDIMRRNVNQVDQHRVLAAMNREFAAVSAGRFATAIVATFWEPTARLVLCNAGHPRPMLRRRGQTHWSPLSLQGRAAPEAPDRAAPGLEPIANLPLGIEEHATYEHLALRLDPGDDLLLYTDALIESSAPGSRQLGEAGLADLLRGRATDPAEGFLRGLMADLSLRAGGSLGDDATALLLRGTQSRASFIAGLAAPLRIARAALAGLARRQVRTIPWPQPRLDNILGPFLPWLNGRRSPPE